MILNADSHSDAVNHLSILFVLQFEKRVIVVHLIPDLFLHAIKMVSKSFSMQQLEFTSVLLS